MKITFLQFLESSKDNKNFFTFFEIFMKNAWKRSLQFSPYLNGSRSCFFLGVNPTHEAKSKKQLLYTKIQTIFRILIKSQNFLI
jgi:hypothetical protein